MRCLLLIIVLMFAAGPAFAQNALTGTWTSDMGDSTLTFQADGTYSLTPSGQSEYKGKYTISGSSATFEDAFGSQICPGTPGVYNFNILINSLEFDPVDDFCTQRRDLLRGNWTKSGM